MCTLRSFQRPAVVAEWYKALSQIQVECLRSQVQISAQNYKLIAQSQKWLVTKWRCDYQIPYKWPCHYSNSRTPCDMCRLRYWNPIDKALKPIWIQAPNQKPALELHSRAAPSVEAHHRSVGPDAGRNSGGRLITKNKKGLLSKQLESISKILNVL